MGLPPKPKKGKTAMENAERYEKALASYTKAREELVKAQIAYDTDRHTYRKGLYDKKEAGERKMTEEQIRSESMVACAETIANYHRAVAKYDIAKEHLEFVKATNN